VGAFWTGPAHVRGRSFFLVVVITAPRDAQQNMPKKHPPTWDVKTTDRLPAPPSRSQRVLVFSFSFSFLGSWVLLTRVPLVCRLYTDAGGLGPWSWVGDAGLGLRNWTGDWRLAKGEATKGASGMSYVTCHMPRATCSHMMDDGVYESESDYLNPIANCQGAEEKIKRENDVHLRQLAKKKRTGTYFFFFSAFLGVSRQGEFENTRIFFEYVSKKNHRGNIFPGGGIFFWVIFLNSFSFRIFCCVG
jgi:hypothetical protein